MSDILNIIQLYPSSPTILEEAMHALCMLTPPWRAGNDELGWYLLGADTLANTLYSTLSRHTLRSTPYSAIDLPSQIREHIVATPRAVTVRELGLWVLITLGKIKHYRPTAILILLDSLQVLTAGRAPWKKEYQAWLLTELTASLLAMHLRGMANADFIKLDNRGLEGLLQFIQTHLIGQGGRGLRKKAYAGWKEVQETLTIHIYDAITDLIRIQSRLNTLHLPGMLKAIADSMKDNILSENCTVKGFNILVCLQLGPQCSPLEGLILTVLQSRWNGNTLTPTIWEQGYHQRRALHTTGVDYDPAETAGSLTLISDVLHAYSFHDSPSHVCGLSGLQKSDRDSFIRTGCHWMRDLATIDMSNLHLIGQLSIKPLLRIPTHMRDETITIGHCMHTLCLLSSSTPTGDLIRKLEGVNTIIAMLPLLFADIKRDALPHDTIHPHNENLRFTLRTLRNLTGPNSDHPQGSRFGTEANLRRVFDTLEAWMGDETSKGLTLQVLLNLSGINATGAFGKPLSLLHRLETDTHKIERTIRSLQHLPSLHHTTQTLGMTILEALTPKGFSLDVRTLDNREFQWRHSLTGILFITLPDLVSVDVKLTYWHCLKGSGCTLAGNIQMPKSANIGELIRMFLWNHPYVAMQAYLHRMIIYDGTGDTRQRISLCTTIWALGSTTHKQAHLLLPDWESGHSDLSPLSQRYPFAATTDPIQSGEAAGTDDLLLDGGEALGRVGHRILRGHQWGKLYGPTTPYKLHVTIIDHHLNPCTPWLANMRTNPRRLCILGDPSSRTIDTQISTQIGRASCRERV